MTKNSYLPLTAALLAGCSTAGPPDQEIEAVRDYVVAAELEPVEVIRISDDTQYDIVNEQYVIVEARDGNYLTEFRRGCRDLRRTGRTQENMYLRSPELADQRTSAHVIRANVDTIRGCRIGTFYGITEEQSKEIMNLGDAPGDEAFIPDQPAEAGEE